MIEGAHHSAAAGDVAAFAAWLSAADHCTPEQRLWFAVLARCWADAFEPGVSTYGSGDDPEAEQAEARRWLTTDLEPWAAAREHVCQAAGLEAEDVKRAARKRLAAIKAEAPLAHGASHAAPTAQVENLTAAERDRLNRRRAARAKHYRRTKAAKAAGLTLAEYDAQQAKAAEEKRKRREYNRECQRAREASRDKWAAIAEANTEAA